MIRRHCRVHREKNIPGIDWVPEGKLRPRGAVRDSEQSVPADSKLVLLINCSKILMSGE